MIKTTKVYPHYVIEPPMKFGNWVKIEFGNDSEADIISHLPEVYPQALLLAQNEKLHKIEIEFPHHWTSLPESLQKLNFFPSLNSFLLKSPFATTPSASSNLIPTIPKFDDLVPLLRQQADYHALLYPNYFKSSTEIDWDYYRQYLEVDFKDSHTIYLTYLDDNHQPIGFIYGGANKTRITIWEMVVDENHRSQGIGRQLLSQFIYLCFQKPAIVDIEVETGWNQLAANLYLKFGFTPFNCTWYQNL